MKTFRAYHIGCGGYLGEVHTEFKKHLQFIGVECPKCKQLVTDYGDSGRILLKEVDEEGKEIE